MSGYHPEQDPSNPDKPDGGDEVAADRSDATKAKDAAATANPDPLEGNKPAQSLEEA